jgi:uncharacterized protein (DUF2236 family)
MPSPIMPAAREWPLLVPQPPTITWQRASDARLVLGAGYALLLQVAHPTVGAGVAEHSRFRSDPWGRLLRTLDYTYTMVYGGPHAAGEMGLRIRAFHRQIRGTRPDGRRYHALEPDAYAWVHATLAEAITLAHERFGRRFSDEEHERFWAEWRALGRLLGIRARDLPADWPGFRQYFECMVADTLEHTRAVDEVLAALGRPAAPRLRAPARPLWPLVQLPLGHVIALASVGLLPATLRARFGLRYDGAQERELRALGAALRAATPLMPASARVTGTDYLVWRRAAITRGDVASGVLRGAADGATDGRRAQPVS